MNNQSEIEALQTLLSRGVITQEQFDQMSAGITGSSSDGTPPFPPPIRSSEFRKKKTVIFAALAVVVVAAGIGLVVKQQKDSQRREAEKLEQQAQEKREQEESEARALNQKACTDRSALATAWGDYVDVLNKHTDYSRASSLTQARRWSLDNNDATSAFRRVLKQVDHPTVISDKDALLRQVNLLEDAYTLMGGADTWSEFNSLITSTNLLGNDLNEFKENIFDSLIKACNGTNS
jgi:hypothetical protein